MPAQLDAQEAVQLNGGDGPDHDPQLTPAEFGRISEFDRAIA
jgi:hypothetical protein